MSSEQAEILTCPCCSGGVGMVWTRHAFDVSYEPVVSYQIRCRECGLATKDYDTEPAAIASWNQRAGAAEPSDADILAHQYEPSFVAKLPLEKRREILRRHAAEEVADVRAKMAEATEDDIRQAITSGYLEVETVSGQPLPETTVYCQGCREKGAELAALRELQKAVDYEILPMKTIASTLYDIYPDAGRLLEWLGELESLTSCDKEMK